MTDNSTLRDKAIHASVLKSLKRDSQQKRKQQRLMYLNQHRKLKEKLLQVNKASELCLLLKMEYLQLQNLINFPKYSEYSIPKKRRGRRQIDAPSEELLLVQKRLNRYFQLVYLGVRPPNVHGFILQVEQDATKANIVENAKVHVGKKAVLTVDLENFFTAISAKRVKDILMSPPFQCNEHIATVLGLLTTYKGRLPQGAPTSPVLSNFACLSLDGALRIWAESNAVNYTRYADDLTFSSDSLFTDEQQEEIRSFIVAAGFTVNEKKLRQRTKNRKQTVTGLTVNSRLNVDRRYLKKVRAMLHDLGVNGIEAATVNHFKLEGAATSEHRKTFVNRLEGSIGFIGQVRGKLDLKYRELLAEFNRLCFSEGEMYIY